MLSGAKLYPISYIHKMKSLISYTLENLETWAFVIKVSFHTPEVIMHARPAKIPVAHHPIAMTAMKLILSVVCLTCFFKQFGNLGHSGFRKSSCCSFYRLWAADKRKSFEERTVPWCTFSLSQGGEQSQADIKVSHLMSFFFLFNSHVVTFVFCTWWCHKHPTNVHVHLTWLISTFVFLKIQQQKQSFCNFDFECVSSKNRLLALSNCFREFLLLAIINLWISVTILYL